MKLENISHVTMVTKIILNCCIELNEYSYIFFRQYINFELLINLK